MLRSDGGTSVLHRGFSGARLACMFAPQALLQQDATCSAYEHSDWEGTA